MPAPAQPRRPDASPEGDQGAGTSRPPDPAVRAGLEGPEPAIRLTFDPKTALEIAKSRSSPRCIRSPASPSDAGGTPRSAGRPTGDRRSSLHAGHLPVHLRPLGDHRGPAGLRLVRIAWDLDRGGIDPGPLGFAAQPVPHATDAGVRSPYPEGDLEEGLRRLDEEADALRRAEREVSGAGTPRSIAQKLASLEIHQANR